MVNKRKYAVTREEALVLMQKFDSAKNYLAKLNSAKEDAAQNLWHFCNWANSDPEKILLLKDGFGGSEAEQLLDKFVYAPLALPESTRWRTINNVRGFYRANYRALQPQAGKMEYNCVKPQRFPTKAQRFDLYKACYTPRDKFLVEASCCTAIARETMSLLKFSHFEKDWMRQDIPHISIPGELLKGHNKGKYRGVRQETFLTPEAKHCLVEYRDWFSKTFSHRWSEGDYVFQAVRGDNEGDEHLAQIGNLVLDIVERANVKFGIHDGRRIVQTALESVGTSPQWIRKIKGRKVSGEENPYSKPCIEQLRQKYREALGELEFLGAGFKVDDKKEFTDDQYRKVEIMIKLSENKAFQKLASEFLDKEK